MRRILVAGLVCIFWGHSAVYGAETLRDEFEKAVKEGKITIDLRYRFEFVDQDGLADKANASTLRSRAGVKSGTFFDFQGALEGENVAQIGGDSYNDTLNGHTSRPVVADVENTEVNQAYLAYTGIPDTAVKGGRQVITHDGHRFIGDVGWRQNNQTFDAAVISNKTIPDTTAHYGFIYNVNRIFGEDSPAGDWGSESHFYHIENISLPAGKLKTYGYLLNFGSDSPANSSQTYGVSLTGTQKVNDEVTVQYLGEYAFQSDYADNTTHYGTSYFHAAPGVVWQGVTTTVGYEMLGSDDGTFGFRTPLATLHKWNGWADKFLTTPATGLEDFYIDMTYKVAGLEGEMELLNDLLNDLLIKLQYHDFSAEDGGMDYGTEWGLYLKKPVNKHVYAEAKYADYDSDGFATDTQKFTFGVGVTY